MTSDYHSQWNNMNYLMKTKLACNTATQDCINHYRMVKMPHQLHQQPVKLEGCGQTE